ncbi:MAG: FG-GAP repeat protein [Saprospiraceae bacterium]
MRFFILFVLIVAFPFLKVIAQNVGIGTSTPLEKLQVEGNILMDTAKLNAILLAPNAGPGKILTSDGMGNGAWENLVLPPPSNNANGNIGYGVWGDCATNGNITDYYPVTDTTGVIGDFFGNSVAISGDFAIVGSPGDDETYNNQGSATIYQFNNGRWERMQKITDPDGSSNDKFGISVSIFGYYAIVGADSDDGPGGTDQGSASIFEFNGVNWVLMVKLIDAFGADSDYFGNSVSISGNYAIVGALRDDATGINHGSASIFVYNGTNWILMQKITDATGADNDYFGCSVSISGNYAIVGAYGDDAPGLTTDQGSASIFEYNGTNWVLMQRITDATGMSYDNFGWSVAISGNYAIVAAEVDDVGNNENQGSASIFQYNGSNWVMMKKLTDDNGAAYDSFGSSVCISGQYVIVGTTYDDVGNSTNRGSSSIYQRVGMAWQKLQYVTDPGGEKDDFFGFSTVIDGSTKRFLIGAADFTDGLGKAVFGKIN